MLSIVIPCYNEELNIASLYQRLWAVLTGIPYQYEIIFVDDGSRDNTLDEIKKLAGIDEGVRFIKFSRNFGHQNALKAGIDLSKGDCIISMDADLQHPPELIPEMIRLWQHGNEVVSALRKSHYHSGFKRISSAAFYSFYNKVSDVKVIKGNADFRLMDRRVADVVTALPERNLFLRGLISWVGFRQATIQYNAAERNAGKTKYSPVKMIGLGIDGITSHSIAPLRISIFIGIIFALLAVAYAIYAIITHFFFSSTVPGWTSIIASILFISALQFVILGIMGEYIGKLFIESKQRPHYLIKETNIITERKMTEALKV